MKFRSAILDTASGSSGGTTASRNKGGQYFRRRAVPTNPNTPNQAAVRNAFASAVFGWAALDTAQANAWNDYATNTAWKDSLGQTIRLTGQQMYIRSAAYRATMDAWGLDGAMVQPADGPSTPGLPSFPPVTSATIEVPALPGDPIPLTITFGSGTPISGFVGVFISRQVKPTINFFKGPYLLAANVAAANTAPLVVDMVDLLGTPWGNQAILPQETQRYYVQLRMYDAAARLSEPLRIGPIEVVAG